MQNILKALVLSVELTHGIARWLALGVVLWAATACGQLMPASKVEMLRQCFPATTDRDLLDIINDDGLLLYSELEMPSAYQGNQGSFRGVFYAFQPVAANADPVARSMGLHPNIGNANTEFPWRTAAGTDDVKNLRTFRFVKLPKSGNGVRWPIVVWQTTLPQDSGPTYQWTFPQGTVVGEVLCMRGPDGYDYTWEVRTRTKDKTFWTPNVWRPYATPEELQAAIAARAPEKSRAVSQSSLKPMTLAERQPLRKIFRQAAGMDVLPDLEDNALVNDLLTSADFKNVHGTPWKTEGQLVAHAPSTEAAWHIVPAGYKGCAIEVSAKSCQRCHETASQNVQEFALNGTGPTRREWYGRIKGSDSVLSFHPFELSSVSRNGANTTVRLRQALLNSGTIAMYDANKHPRDVYIRIPEFDAMTTSRPPASIRNTVGG